MTEKRYGQVRRRLGEWERFRERAIRVDVLAECVIQTASPGVDMQPRKKSALQEERRVDSLQRFGPSRLREGWLLTNCAKVCVTKSTY